MSKNPEDYIYEEINFDNLRGKIEEYMSTWVDMEGKSAYFTYRDLEHHLLGDDAKEDVRLGFNTSAEVSKVLNEMLLEGFIYQNFGWSSQCFNNEEGCGVSNFVFGITDKFVPVEKKN